MRRLGTVFVVGLATLIAFKALFGVVIPSVVFVIKLAWRAIEVAAIAGVVWLAYTYLRDRARKSSG